MYKCQICQQVVPPKTKAHRVVVETRKREYPYRHRANKFFDDGKIKYKDDPGGTGYETVREVIACPECAAQFKKD